MNYDTGEKSVQKPKTSRLEIASLVLAILSLLFPPLAILAIILSIGCIFKIRKNAGRLKGMGLITYTMITATVSIALWTMAFLVWSRDAAPIPNDYTIADFRSALPECNPSYELLKSLTDKVDYGSNDAPAIGLSEQDITVISELKELFKESDWANIPPAVKENEANIIQAWQNSKKARDIIKGLNKFGEIADLTDPNIPAQFKLSYRITVNLMRLSHLYHAYIYLQSDHDNIYYAVTELIEIDSACRKLCSNARNFLSKLTCTSILNSNIEIANFIANNPNTPKESLELLSWQFKPLTNEQYSMRNPLIYEYLLHKRDAHILEMTGCAKLLFKRNSILRVYRNFYDHQINGLNTMPEARRRRLSVWPSKYMDWLPVSIGSENRLPWYYICYNPTGIILIRNSLPQKWRYESKATIDFPIRSDLLQIVLNKRLGKEISLKARAYSDEYIIDVENKKIFSPGPDSQPHTKDDIKLVIKPEVLGFSD
ncbi:MAG: DUF4190 domain-containing protein [Planctomycetota bacterium]